MRTNDSSLGRCGLMESYGWQGYLLLLIGVCNSTSFMAFSSLGFAPGFSPCLRRCLSLHERALSPRAGVSYWSHSPWLGTKKKKNPPRWCSNLWLCFMSGFLWPCLSYDFCGCTVWISVVIFVLFLFTCLKLVTMDVFLTT